MANAKETQLLPRCDVCGGIAVCGIQDIQELPPQQGRDGQFWQCWGPKGPIQYFCLAHRRKPAEHKMTDRQRVDLMEAAQAVA